MTVKPTTLPIGFSCIEGGVEMITDFVPMYYDVWCKANGITYAAEVHDNYTRMLFDEDDGQTCFVLRWHNAWGQEE